MKTKVIRKTSRAALAVLILIAALFIAAPTKAYADNTEAKELVTEYGDLWTGRISVKAGETVKWYVNVPDDVVKDLLDRAYTVVFESLSKKRQREILEEAN